MSWLGYDAQIESRDDFRAFLVELAKELRDNPESWTTTDLAEFIERVAFYAGAPLEGFQSNLRPGVSPDAASWRTFADMLAGAGVYE